VTDGDCVHRRRSVNPAWPDLLDQSHGQATLSRHPRTANRRYLATTIPQGAIVDLDGFALIFAPGNLGGAIQSKDLQAIDA
jgi:hypothetical protein